MMQKYTKYAVWYHESYKLYYQSSKICCFIFWTSLRLDDFSHSSKNCQCLKNKRNAICDINSLQQNSINYTGIARKIINQVCTSLWNSVALAPQWRCTRPNVALVHSVQFEAKVLNVSTVFVPWLPTLIPSDMRSGCDFPSCVSSCFARASTVKLLGPVRPNWELRPTCEHVNKLLT